MTGYLDFEDLKPKYIYLIFATLVGRFQGRVLISLDREIYAVCTYVSLISFNLTPHKTKFNNH